MIVQVAECPQLRCHSFRELTGRKIDLFLFYFVDYAWALLWALCLWAPPYGNGGIEQDYSSHGLCVSYNKDHVHCEKTAARGNFWNETASLCFKRAVGSDGGDAHSSQSKGKVIHVWTFLKALSQESEHPLLDLGRRDDAMLTYTGSEAWVTQTDGWQGFVLPRTQRAVKRQMFLWVQFGCEFC